MIAKRGFLLLYSNFNCSMPQRYIMRATSIVISLGLLCNSKDEMNLQRPLCISQLLIVIEYNWSRFFIEMCFLGN